VAPRLGAVARRADTPWSATTPYARQVQDAAALLAGVLPGPPGAGLWLTSFDDAAATRADGDLWFTPSADTNEVVPPPIVTYDPREIPLPLDVLAGLALLGVWLWRRVRRS
jgi:hypothetical protein